jgi:hypothetical protein
MLAKFLAGLIVFLGYMAMVVALAVIMAFPVKWLVNYVFTDAVRLTVFGVAQITVWRALALNILCGFLFKSSSSSSKS